MKTTWLSNIDHPNIRPDSPLYELTRWPPPNDQPVSTDTAGKVISRVGDDIYDFSSYAKIGCRIRFDDMRLTAVNRRRFKRVVCWWLWGPRGKITAVTVSNYATIIKPLFLLASSLNIDVRDLSAKPDCASLIAPMLGVSMFDTFLMLLNELFVGRAELGFTLLDRRTLTNLVRLMPAHELQQTAYIPPRIWLYQVTQLKACVEDYNQHREKLEDLFDYCLQAYISNYGSVEAACHPDGTHRLGPFCSDVSSPHRYIGPFAESAKQFEVDALLTRWLRPSSGKVVNEDLVGIQRLAAYFNLVQAAGMAHILNFTAMRSIEAKGLRSSCFLTEENEHFGVIYMLRADTSKTIREQGTLWITSPSVEASVRALVSIAKLRVSVAKHDPNVHISEQDLNDPLLYTPSYEPWAVIGEVVRDRGPTARQRLGYDQVLARYPSLLDKEKLSITDDDLHVARRITPTLEPKIYTVGSTWPLAFHQLRRTAAVNMTASGLVDTSSIQYQLKHLLREQSLYYGRGFSKLRLNERAREEFIRTTYEMLALQADHLSDARYVSPHGPEGKRRIIRMVEGKDSKEIVKAAKRGLVSFRKTLFGGCTKPGPCPFGGVDNVSQCAWCIDAVIDRQKKDEITSIGRNVKERIDRAPPNSPRRRSLEAQQSSILMALRLIKSKREA